MTMKMLIHAPTADALARARNNLRNLLRADPGIEVELVANGEAVTYALDTPDTEADVYLLVCENTLNLADRQAPAGMRTVNAAIHYIAVRQSEGWSYFRA